MKAPSPAKEAGKLSGMMNLPRLLMEAVRVHHVYARPLDTVGEALHGATVEETEAKYAAEMDCGEYGRVKCKPATKRGRACLHNAAVRRHLARDRGAR